MKRIVFALGFFLILFAVVSASSEKIRIMLAVSSSGDAGHPDAVPAQTGAADHMAPPPDGWVAQALSDDLRLGPDPLATPGGVAYVSGAQVVTMNIAFGMESPMPDLEDALPYAIVKGLVFFDLSDPATDGAVRQFAATIGGQADINVWSNASDADTLSVLSGLDVAALNASLEVPSLAIAQSDQVVLFDDAPDDLLSQLATAGAAQAVATAKPEGGVIARFKNRVAKAKAKYGEKTNDASAQNGDPSASGAGVKDAVVRAVKMNCRMEKTIKRCTITPVED